MTLKGKKILAVEDSISIRTFLRISLQSEGVDFFEAVNATEAIDLCKKVQPDIIVLDLGLPDRDGLDILPELKKISNPAIVILSVRKEQETINKAYSLGASGYLSKPFMMETLVELLEKAAKNTL